jgi:pyruvate/2-oxoglutarate dehydrogenase complex dihydrolipoamide acyltransferase (E2) component
MTNKIEQNLYVPDIGKHDSLELLNWLIDEGCEFHCGQEICELVTDKAVFPLEAEKNGILTKIYTYAPAEVKVHQLLGKFIYLD